MRPRRSRIAGESRNPDYSLKGGIPSFKKDENGKRLAPVSQFNTWWGRVLGKDVCAKKGSKESSSSRSKRSTVSRAANPTPEAESSRYPQTNASRSGHAPRNSHMQSNSTLKRPLSFAEIYLKKAEAMKCKEAAQRHCATRNSNAEAPRIKEPDMWENAGRNYLCTNGVLGR